MPLIQHCWFRLQFAPKLTSLLHSQRATFIDARVKWVRDRSLDLVVEKEKHLRPFHALKDLFLLGGHHPAPSLSLSSISARRDSLSLPFPALRFIRKFPSAFTEDCSSPTVHILPTEELRRLHNDEVEVHESRKAESAARLLRLLMLTRQRSLPLDIVDHMCWDLGLPKDYVRSLLPDYPDYFNIVQSSSGGTFNLELVCWNAGLAVSEIERRGLRPEFPQSFPPGFSLEKRVKQWTDTLQELPYMSPYEDGTVLDPKIPVAEKWVIGVLHEMLHLMVSKKTEKENLLKLGEHVGLPMGFRKALLRYPGIFYLSNKNRTQTVVLREAFRRDMLTEKHPLMAMRYRYIHLMHKEEEKRGEEREKGREKEEDRRAMCSAELPLC